MNTKWSSQMSELTTMGNDIIKNRCHFKETTNKIQFYLNWSLDAECVIASTTPERNVDSLAQQRLFLSRDGRCSEGFEFEHHPIHPWLEHIQFNKLRWIEPTPIDMNEKKEESQKRKTTCISWVIAVDPVESPLALPQRLFNSSSRSSWHLTNLHFNHQIFTEINYAILSILNKSSSKSSNLDFGAGSIFQLRRSFWGWFQFSS